MPMALTNSGRSESWSNSCAQNWAKYCVPISQLHVQPLGQSTPSQTMSSYKSSTSVEWVTTLSSCPLTLCWNGTDWYTYAEDGDRSYFHRLAASTSLFSANREHLSEGIWVFGPPFLSSFTIPTIFATFPRYLLTTKTILLPHSSTLIEYAVSSFP